MARRRSSPSQKVIDLIMLLAVFALPGFHGVMMHSHEVVLREELFTHTQPD